ncbi:MAG: DUF5817 domain-containing protein [Halobacteriota archaeon]
MMPVYSVIVCPKCRKSAQLIEQKGTKTTRCQRCGATLQTRKLRIFHTTDKLEEAIAVRTGLQAEILGKSYDSTKRCGSSAFTPFSTFTSSTDLEPFLCQDTEHLSRSGSEKKEITVNCKEKPHKKMVRSKNKDPAKTIILILKRTGVEMQVNEFHEHPLMQDFDNDIIDTYLKRLLLKGEIYSPKNGYIRLVP